jgi:hypothetical protein
VKAHAVAGELRFEPAAAEGCALACEKLIDYMEGQLQTATLLSNVDGFGHTVVGRALPRKSATQAEEAVKVLTAHRALLTDMASTNCQTAKNDTATGGSKAHGMRAAHEMVGNVGVGGRGCGGSGAWVVSDLGPGRVGWCVEDAVVSCGGVANCYFCGPA